MSQAAFGDHNVAFAVVAALAEMVLTGTDTAAGRFIPHISHHGSNATLTAYIGWNLIRVRRTFLVVFAAYGLFLAAATMADVLGLKNFGTYHLVLYSFWIGPLAAWCLLLARYLVVGGHDLVGGVFATLVPNAFMLSFVAIALWGLHVSVNRPSVIVVIWAAAFLLLSIALFFVVRRLEPVIYEAIRKFRRHVTAAGHVEWARASSSMFVSRVSGLLLWYAELFILEVAAPRESAVGLYAAALLIARILRLVPNYVMYMVTPLVGADYDDVHEYPELQRGIDRANAIVFPISVLVLAVIFIWPRDLLEIFGSGFQVAGGALKLLAVGGFVTALTRQSRAILMASGGEHVVSRLSTATLLVLVAAGIPASRFFSLDGLALVSCVTMVGEGIGFYVFARRQLPAIRPLSLA